MEVELLDGTSSTTSSGKSAQSGPRGEWSSTTLSDVRVADPLVHSEVHVNENAVTSPMPGTVSAVLVGPGQAMSKGQAVLVLEAMKMENDIAAPKDGTIGRMLVEEGQAVQSGTPLFEMA